MDILTQLQNCLDQLATQLYASLHYLSTHHPDQPTPPGAALPQPPNQPQPQPQPQPSTSDPTAPLSDNTRDDPVLFAQRQRELAKDLVLKEGQITYLISRLPGLGSSETEQEARIKELEVELRAVRGEKRIVRRELDEAVGRLEGVLKGARRGVRTGGGGGRRVEEEDVGGVGGGGGGEEEKEEAEKEKFGNGGAEWEW